MMAILSEVRRWWALVASIAAGVLVLVLLPAGAFKDVTQELMALFGLMMAGVLPTMVLTASVLRAGNLSVQKIKSYRDALRSQMIIWIGLFVISLGASILIVVGKMLSWSLPVVIPLSYFGYSNTEFDLIRVVNALIATSLSLLLLRAISVGNGIISLLRLSAELAIGEAHAREDGSRKSAEQAIANISERDGFGKYVELPH